jgi:hypothetical protein
MTVPPFTQAFEWAVELLAFLGREGLLLASVLLLFLVLWGYGRAVGLPNLFWRATVDASSEKPWARLAIGFAVGMLLGADAFLGVLVESAQATWTAEFFFRWFCGLCAGAAVLVFAIWLWRPSGRPGKEAMLSQRRREFVSLPIGSAVGLLTFVVLVWVFSEKTPAWTAQLIDRVVPELSIETAQVPRRGGGSSFPWHRTVLGFAEAQPSKAP